MEKIKVKLVRTTADLKILKGEGLVQQLLPPHTADKEVELIMVSGTILFTLAGQTHTLQAGDFQVIPANELHSLKVQADCQFYLIMAASTKMSFSAPKV